jgi:NADPH-dependent 2,4-dienoyl-CoA reductase/sulfur reductase-like enzyme
MIAIVGAGPAGMAAAVSARECNQPVTLIDDNPTPGGQIWRGGEGSEWFEKLIRSGAKLMLGARVIGGDVNRRTLRIETRTHAGDLEYEKLILATGSRELFLPFPGWTLPNVMGVGGLQAMVKTGMPIEGKRVVVAGTGPLLLAVAAFLRKRGAIVPAVVEQARWDKLLPFMASLPPGKLLQAAALGTAFYQADNWVVAAEGTGKLERVRLRAGNTIQCDYLAVAYGFVENSELAEHFGCDAIPGTGGVDLSIVEGRIVGYRAAGREDLARKWQPERAKQLRFAEALNRTFELRPELRQLAKPSTMVCRCEDVTLGQLRSADSWRSAKLHFRCGMGPCQGRVCGPAVNFLFGWQSDSVRPPVFPARVSSLLSNREPTTK